MSETLASTWEQVRKALTKTFPQFYALEPGGPLALDIGEDGWLLEVKPDGRLFCQYGVAIDEVQCLMSEGTPEDLGTDEIAKQAKYFIQPTVGKFRPLLLQSGFTEELEMNEEYVAVTFARPVDFQNLAKVEDLIRWCRRQFGGGA